MSAPFKRHYATARSGSVGASGMRMALDCGRSVYEAVDRRMPEAAALAAWLGQSAAAGFVARMCRTSLGVLKGIDDRRFQPGALSCLSNIIPRDAVIFPGKGIG